MMKFNKKKTIKSSLFLLTPALLATAITPVVSCNNNPKTKELTFWEKFNNLKLNLSLNSEGKKKTASEFYKEVKSGSIYSVLSKYTNYNSFLQSITNLDAEVKAINSINLSNSGSSVSLNIKIGEKNNEQNDTDLNYSIIGFVKDQEQLNNLINEVTSQFKNLVLSPRNVNNYITAEDVWNVWNNKDQAENSQNIISLYNYISGLPNEFYDESLYDESGIIKYNEVSIKLENVLWNNEETNASLKASTLFLTFSLYVSQTLANGKIIQSSSVVEKEISTYPSNQTKFNQLISDFEREKGHITIKNSLIAPQVIVNEFDLAVDYEDKMKILQNYLSFPVETLSYGLIWKIKTIFIGSNDAVLDIEFNLSWKDLGQNIVVSISPFLSNDAYINSILASLKELQLNPTSEGKKYSAEEVVDFWSKDKNSFYDYIQGLPENSESVKYIVSNLTWNNDAEIEQRGTTAFVDLTVLYNNNEYPIRLKEISGFISPYVYASTKFDEFINGISISLKKEYHNKEIINLTNASNWMNKLDGVQELLNQNDEYSISNLQFNYNENDGRKGRLSISFTYSWEAKYKDKKIGATIKRPIERIVENYKTYDDQASENFNLISNQVSSSSIYLDSIIVDSMNKADFLTSYFAVDSVNISGNINSDAFKENFTKLFNIPNLFGINFWILSIEYSGNNNSLLDTQLKVSYKFSNIYNSKKVIEKTDIVDGFMDPYGFDKIKKVLSMSDMSHYNDKNQYQKYAQVPNDIKMGTCNWQNAWFHEDHDWGGWGWNPPFRSYRDWGGKTDANSLALRGAYYDHIISNKHAEKTLSYYGLLGSSEMLANVEYFATWQGAPYRTGYKDNDGVCAFPMGFKITYRTQKVDKFGNAAKGKYDEKQTKNLVIWMYYDDMFWK